MFRLGTKRVMAKESESAGRGVAHSSVGSRRAHQNGPVTRGADRDQRRGAGTNDPKRILVYGVTGSGKTSLAQRIAEILALPWHSMDDEVGWLPGWVERPRA